MGLAIPVTLALHPPRLLVKIIIVNILIPIIINYFHILTPSVQQQNHIVQSGNGNTSNFGPSLQMNAFSAQLTTLTKVVDLLVSNRKSVETGNHEKSASSLPPPARKDPAKQHHNTTYQINEESPPHRRQSSQDHDNKDRRSRGDYQESRSHGYDESPPRRRRSYDENDENRDHWRRYLLFYNVYHDE